MNLRRLVGVLVSTSAVQSLAQEYRSFDGTGNNLTNPAYGQSGQALERLTPANYGDGVSTVDGTLPGPRQISNAVFAQSSSQPDARGVSEWVWVWGQFIDHDVDHTLTSPSAGTLNITVPTDDPFFGDLSPNNQIHVTRSSFTGGTGVGDPREQLSNITPWIDGGMIYGGRAVDGPVGVDRTTWLRANDGTGHLRTSNGGALGDLMPRYVDGSSPTMANVGVPTMTSGASVGDLAFVAGDVRANENGALLATHTVFLREHNRVADIIRSNNPSWTDDQIYNSARKIVGMEVQAITYREYLPAMGVNLSAYSGYDDTVNPGILNEFSAAAFRMGHDQINNVMLRLDASGNVVPEGNLSIADHFFTPSRLTEAGLEPILRGLSAQVQEATDGQFVDGLRNQLFHAFIPGFGLVDNATDLAAIDIMRARDHGLGSFNDVRAVLGLPTISSFSDLTSDAAVVAALDNLYGTGNVGNLDLFVGMLVEEVASGSSLSPTVIAILARQFEALRDGDRFFYESSAMLADSDLNMMGAWDGTNSTSAAAWGQSLTLARILELNTDVTGLQENVFFAVPEPTAATLCGALFLAASFRRRRK